MLLHIANPSTGCLQTLKVEEEQKIRAFVDKRISHEVSGDILGANFKGYVLRITGGNDAQGFPMMQGVLAAERRRLLLAKGDKCFRPRKKGERKKKSVRGCVVGSDLAALNLVIVRKGDNEIPGLTDQVQSRRYGPKRASKIRKYFNLSKQDDVRKFVVRRPVVSKNPKIKNPTVCPKIQRLVTPERRWRKRQIKKARVAKGLESRKASEEFKATLDARRKEKREALAAERKRSLSRKLSTKKGGEVVNAAAAAKKAAEKEARRKAHFEERAKISKEKAAKKEASKKKKAASASKKASSKK